MTMAETSLRHDAVFGKRVATPARRNISLFRRSSILSVLLGHAERWIQVISATRLPVKTSMYQLDIAGSRQ